MASFGVYLASISAPIAKRVLIGLGVGVVSYVGLSVVFDEILLNAQGNWAVIPSAVANMLTLAGVPDSIGIIFGALATRLTMIQLKHLAPVA